MPAEMWLHILCFSYLFLSLVACMCGTASLQALSDCTMCWLLKWEPRCEPAEALEVASRLCQVSLSSVPCESIMMEGEAVTRSVCPRPGEPTWATAARLDYSCCWNTPQLPLSELFLSCNFTVALAQSPELNFSPFPQSGGGRGANVIDEIAPTPPWSSLLIKETELLPHWLFSAFSSAPQNEQQQQRCSSQCQHDIFSCTKIIQSFPLWNKAFVVRWDLRRCCRVRGSTRWWVNELTCSIQPTSPTDPLGLFTWDILSTWEDNRQKTSLPFLDRPKTVCVSDGGRNWGQGRGTEETDAIRDAVVCPVVLPAQLCWLEQWLFTLLLPENICAGKCPSADAVVSLEKDFAGIVCYLLRASLRYSSWRRLQ